MVPPKVKLSGLPRTISNTALWVRFGIRFGPFGFAVPFGACGVEFPICDLDSQLTEAFTINLPSGRTLLTRRNLLRFHITTDAFTFFSLKQKPFHFRLKAEGFPFSP